MTLWLRSVLKHGHSEGYGTAYELIDETLDECLSFLQLAVNVFRETNQNNMLREVYQSLCLFERALYLPKKERLEFMSTQVLFCCFMVHILAYYNQNRREEGDAATTTTAIVVQRVTQLGSICQFLVGDFIHNCKSLMVSFDNTLLTNLKNEIELRTKNVIKHCISKREKQQHQNSFMTTNALISQHLVFV